MSEKQFDLGWGDEEEPEQAADTLTVVDRARDVHRQQTQATLIAEHVAAAVEEARPGLDKIPDPVEPAGEGELTAEEKERLDVCVGGVELLTTAFWIAGKSLDTIATGRLFRRIPHKLKPGEYYTTIEDWCWTEHGIKQTRCSKLRAGWRIGQALAARGYDAPEGQVRELVPLKNKHGLNAAVALYEVVVQADGKDKVTAERLRETVKMLPGDLALKDDEDADQIARMLEGVLENAEPKELPASTAIPAAVRRSVDRRAVALADVLNRSRIPRTEVERHLLEAFADEDDTTVFDAVLARMKHAGGKK
ncbi:hypothetical protein [Streptomyces sp. CL12-4]|uniref:hypothetical protein n=1 Tax=Streptomyces sp. CL12-4 TaxID=2810306 RepID=UPI001EFB2440|nr:hypothetical protein [Streptomyces sp. CL12-4]MCG8971850.1 hypothetical protein [Streptomyces sp. CL12-4]